MPKFIGDYFAERTTATPSPDDYLLTYDNASNQIVKSPIESLPIEVTNASGLVTSARNSTGSTLYKGTIVYVSGGIGGNPTVAKARANTEALSSGTFGVVYADIPNNTVGTILVAGKIDTLDTRTTATNPFTSVTLADGDRIYLDPNTAGYITNVKPVAPNHMVYLGVVTNTSPTSGTIEYKIINGFELDEIHDVLITSKTDGDFLVYENATTLWKNKSASTLGIVTTSGTQTLTNKTLTSPILTNPTLTNPTLTTPALGTPSSGDLTNCTGIATGLTSGITNALKSATTTINVSSATAPTSGQVLTATSATTANWQTPSSSSTFSGCKCNSTSSSITTSSSAIAWNGEEYDTNNYHDNVTNNTRLTIPTTGYYEIGANINTSASTSSSVSFEIILRLNGSTTISRNSLFASQNFVNVAYGIHTIRYMTAGDYIEVLSSNSFTTFTIVSPSSFYITRLG